MAIKKLQNDYTTPEQSKRLLELGVPADSANYCYYVKDKCAPIEIIPPGNRDTQHTFSTFAKGYNDVFYPENPSLFEWDNVDVLPSWSVGRLIEIFDICYSGTDVNEKWENHNALHKGQTYMNYIMYVFDYNYMCGKLDFSKLEE